MHYTTPFLGLLASLAAAQNAFTMSSLDGITADVPYELTWGPTTDGTVTLLLRQGTPTNLTTVETIAASIPNSGSYTWTSSPSLPAASNYAFEIVDDADTTMVNYSGLFPISSPGIASSAAASSTIASASSSTSPLYTDYIITLSPSATGTGISNSTLANTTATGIYSNYSTNQTANWPVTSAKVTLGNTRTATQVTDPTGTGGASGTASGSGSALPTQTANAAVGLRVLKLGGLVGVLGAVGLVL